MENWKSYVEMFNAAVGAIQSSTPLLMVVAGYVIGKMLKKCERIDNDSIPVLLGCAGFLLGGLLLSASWTTIELVKGELFGMVLMWASVGLHQTMKSTVLLPKVSDSDKPEGVL